MPKFADTFTDEQRRAIVAAVLDRDGPRLNRKEAMRAALAGKLPGIAEPFAMSYQYVCQLVAEEHERRQPNTLKDSKRDAPEAIDAMAKRLLRIEERELARIEKEARTKPRNEARVRGVARNLEAIGKVLDRKPEQTGAPKTTGKSGTPAAGGQSEAGGLIARLAAQHDADASPSSTAPQPTETQGDNGEATQTHVATEESEAERAQHNAEQEEDERANGFPSRSRDPPADASAGRVALRRVAGGGV